MVVTWWIVAFCTVSMAHTDTYIQFIKEEMIKKDLTQCHMLRKIPTQSNKFVQIITSILTHVYSS